MGVKTFLLVKEFDTQKKAEKFARSFDEARKQMKLSPLKVKGDVQTGKWVVVDPERDDLKKWPR